jgi:hypothetical protein
MRRCIGKNPSPTKINFYVGLGCIQKFAYIREKLN